MTMTPKAIAGAVVTSVDSEGGVARGVNERKGNDVGGTVVVWCGVSGSPQRVPWGRNSHVAEGTIT
jgi:hypothetical protein